MTAKSLRLTARAAAASCATTRPSSVRRITDCETNAASSGHNELFMQHTPLLVNYRATALATIREAETMQADVEVLATTARHTLGAGNPLAALLDDVRAFAAFNFERAARLEAMSAEFERPAAGLQHAAHLYEGEGKLVAMLLERILAKHRVALESGAAKPVIDQFANDARSIVDAYAARIVGF